MVKKRELDDIPVAKKLSGYHPRLVIDLPITELPICVVKGEVTWIPLQIL